MRSRRWAAPISSFRGSVSISDTFMISIMNRCEVVYKREGYTRDMEIIFIRHGLAASNTLLPHENRVGSDQPLVPEGEQQIRQTATALARLALEHVITLPEMIYSSPYLRTHQSAQIIAQQLKLPVAIDDRLREIGKGSLVGKTVEEALEYENAIEHHERPANRPPGGGENWLDIAERMTKFIDEHEKQGETSLLIVSHNHPIECAIGKLTGQPTENWENRPIDNATISRVVKHDEIWRIDEGLYNYRPE